MDLSMSCLLQLAVAVLCLATAPARAEDDPLAAIAGATGPDAARRALAGVAARTGDRWLGIGNFSSPRP